MRMPNSMERRLAPTPMPPYPAALASRGTRRMIRQTPQMTTRMTMRAIMIMESKRVSPATDMEIMMTKRWNRAVRVRVIVIARTTSTAPAWVRMTSSHRPGSLPHMLFPLGPSTSTPTTRSTRSTLSPLRTTSSTVKATMGVTSTATWRSSSRITASSSRPMVHLRLTSLIVRLSLQDAKSPQVLPPLARDQPTRPRV